MNEQIRKLRKVISEQDYKIRAIEGVETEGSQRKEGICIGKGQRKRSGESSLEVPEMSVRGNAHYMGHIQRWKISNNEDCFLCLAVCHIDRVDIFFLIVALLLC